MDSRAKDKTYLVTSVIILFLNIKQTTYSKYELGKINIPIEMLIKLADFYDVSLDYLTGRDSKKK